jgi:hypothetical protein
VKPCNAEAYGPREEILKKLLGILLQPKHPAWQAAIAALKTDPDAPLPSG